MNTPETDPLKLWTSFNEYLEKEINLMLTEAPVDWKSDSERTSFLMEKILPNIAQSMKLEIQYEVPFRIDATFLHLGKYHYKIPLIVVESENNTQAAEEEFFKLCLVNAPVKILVVYDSNEDPLTYFGKDWFDYIRSDFHEQKVDPGFMIVLVFNRERLSLPKVVYYHPGTFQATLNPENAS